MRNMRASLARTLAMGILAPLMLMICAAGPAAAAQSVSDDSGVVAGALSAVARPLAAVEPHLSDAVGTAAAAPTADGKGFWTVTSRGTVSVQGDATSYGDASSLNLKGSIVSIAPTFDGRGYWLLGSDGGVFSYGDASFYGSTGNLVLNAPALQMVSTPDSRGYWFVASDGGIFSYGDARFFGSTGAWHLNRPVVGMADTSSGSGYWLVAADGGIFSFGNAAFFGSTGAISLNEPVVGMASTSDSRGYWLVAADGGIFSFGDSQFHGSAVGDASPGTVVSIVATGDGGGYWVIGNDGSIYAYGDAATTGGGAPSTGIALSPEYLGETSAIDSQSFSTNDSVHAVNGQNYSQSVVGTTWITGNPLIPANIAYAEWDLGRNYNFLNTTLGLDDTSQPSDVLVRFQIYGDNNLLFTRDISLGQDIPIHLSVEGVLRLKLEVTELSGSTEDVQAESVFGSAQVTP